MPNSIRVSLDPVPVVQPSGLAGKPAAVLGMRPRFAVRGAGLSNAAKGAPVAAKLEFLGCFSNSKSTDSETHEAALGTLEGQLELRGSPPSVMFLCDSASLDRLVQPQPSEVALEQGIEQSGPPPRALDLQLDSDAFKGIDPSALMPQLLLPPETDSYEYLRVHVQLTVAVTLESSREVDDILDVPLWAEAPARARRYEVQVVDEVGQPLQGVALRFEVSGQVIQRTTNSDGLAFVLCSTKASAIVEVLDPEALTPELKDRWSHARGAPILRPSDALIDRTPRELEGKFDVAPMKRSTLCIRPPVELARMRGMYFDTEKCFLLPTAIGSMKELVKLYERHPDTELLVVGHTDTTGDDSYNETLSLERAKAMAAYLKNEVESWTAWYSGNKSDAKRWGEIEDSEMITTLAEVHGFDSEPEPVAAYQAWHNGLSDGARASNWKALEEDGKIGPETRGQLVGDYMNLQGTTLPDDVSLTRHGCGEYFPLDEEEADLDSDAPDEQEDQGDRRVELFFFDKPFGILPPAPGETSARGSVEYPEWVRRAKILQLLSEKRSRSRDDYPFSL